MEGRAHREHSDDQSVRRARSQLGESLVELLATITIVSICVVGLVAALGMNFVFSSTNRENERGHQILTRYAEALAGESYQACVVGQAAPYAGVAVSDIPSTNLPDNVTVGAPGTIPASAEAYDVSIESVQYWNGDSSPATFTSTCPNPDPKFQQLVLKAHSGDGTYVERITIFKRLP
jgi:hypothetical protein